MLYLYVGLIELVPNKETDNIERSNDGKVMHTDCIKIY